MKLLVLLFALWQVGTLMICKIYTFVFLKDGLEKTYQIPATSEQNALVRLGQIYGDKEGREDIQIEILEIK